MQGKSVKEIHLDLVRVTEAAAIAASKWVGCGDKEQADKAATEAMRDRFNKINFSGRVVLGEGIKDGSYGLFEGEKVGRYSKVSEHHTHDIYTYDIVADPIEGTTPTANGLYEAMSVIAVGAKDSLFYSPVFYMKKLALGPKIPSSSVDITDPAWKIIEVVAEATSKPKDRLTVCVLDRPRHDDLIHQIRELGCRIRLISDCDISGALATCVPQSGIDIYMGIGGTPEGVISAAALKCMGGYFQGVLCEKNGQLLDENVYDISQLIKSDVIFCATGITSGMLLNGVIYPEGKSQTHSILMRSQSGTIRWITTLHGN